MNKILFLILIISTNSLHSLGQNIQSPLQFDGIYYSFDGLKDTQGEETMDCLIFYKNGKVLRQRAMAFELNDIDKWLKFILSKDIALFNYSIKKESVHFTYQSDIIVTDYDAKIYKDSLNVKTTINTGEKMIIKANTYFYKEFKSSK